MTRHLAWIILTTLACGAIGDTEIFTNSYFGFHDKIDVFFLLPVKILLSPARCL